MTRFISMIKVLAVTETCSWMEVFSSKYIGLYFWKGG